MKGYRISNVKALEFDSQLYDTHTFRTTFYLNVVQKENKML